MSEETGQARPPEPKPTKPYPGVSAQHRSEPGGFTIGSQSASTINNTARDQYISNQYELRIKPMRRRGRVLLAAGSALLGAGLGVGLGALLGAPLLLLPVAALVALAGVALMLAGVSVRRRARRAEARL
jgi:hypothetical protein